MGWIGGEFSGLFSDLPAEEAGSESRYLTNFKAVLILSLFFNIFYTYPQSVLKFD